MDRLWIGETTLDNTELIYTISAISRRKLTRKLMESFPSSIVARYGVELSNVTRKNSWNSGYGDKIFVESIKGFLK